MLRRKNTAPQAKKGRFWIRIGAIVMVLIALITTVWYFTLHRVQYQPEWYESMQRKPLTALPENGRAVIQTPVGFINTADSVFIATEAGPITISPDQESAGAQPVSAHAKAKASASIWARVQRDLNQKGRAIILSYELVPLFIEVLKVQGRPEWAAMIKAGKSTIHKDHVVTETMLDLTKVSSRQLRTKAAQAWEMVQEMIPKDRLAQIYLKVDTSPVVERGYLLPGAEASLSIGKIALPVGELEKRFNRPIQIEMDRFMFSKIEIGEGQMVLIK
jgi:hypothetical protein